MQHAAFFDLDYTLYHGYSASLFTLFLVEHGYVGERAAKEVDQFTQEYYAGLIDYRQATKRSLELSARCVKGRSEVTVQNWLSEFLKTNYHFYPWADELMRLLSDGGFETYLISAAPTNIVQAAAAELGVGHVYGTEFELQARRYTGNLGPLLNYDEKRRLVLKLTHKTQGVRIGFGDSVGDVDMLNAMDKAVLYNPRPAELIKLAKERNWSIANEQTILPIVRGFVE